MNFRGLLVIFAAALVAVHGDSIDHDKVVPFLSPTQSPFGQPMLDYSSRTSDFQPLIVWEQLTEAARFTLNATDFGDAFVPVNDANFEEKLKKAWPF